MKLKHNFGITFYYGKPIEVLQTHIKQIHDKGFDYMMTSTDSRYVLQNKSTWMDQVQYARLYGLKNWCLHAPYDFDIARFWDNKDPKESKKIIDTLKQNIDFCDNYDVRRLVIHLDTDSDYISYTVVGKKRIKELVKYAKRKDVTLCVENICSTELIEKILDENHNNYLAFCYDVGHEHVFSEKDMFYMLHKYHDRIQVLHIHDNHGFKDEHLPIGFGNIDWKQFADLVQKYNVDIPLTLEVLKPVPGKENEQLDLCINGLTKYFNDNKKVEFEK